MTLVDGGVRDNLGISWYDLGPAMDELIVVSAAANRHAKKNVARIPDLNELFALLQTVNIPYNTRERNQRRAIAAELLAKPWTDESQVAGGAIIHIEDSPFDLARKIKSKSDDAKSLRGPDWEVDQNINVERLFKAAGNKADMLTKRASEVMKYLDRVEQHLPDPSVLTDSDYLELRRKAGYVSDAELAWWLRAQASALIGTKLSRIPRENALNLILHGYYLTMANMHICADWPLTKALDSQRLGRLFQDVPASPVKQQQLDRARAEVEKLQARPLAPHYPVLMLLPVIARVRERGRLQRKSAIVGLAVNARSKIEILGIWIAPARREFPDEKSPYEAAKRADEDLRERAQTFWQELVTNIRQRGVERISFCIRDVPIGLSGSERRVSARDRDEAIRATYPRTLLQPRVSRLQQESTLWLFIAQERELTKDFKEIFLAPSEPAAREVHEKFRKKWDHKGAKIADALANVWGDLAPSFRYSIEARHMLMNVEAVVDATEHMLNEPRRERGYASCEVIAIGELIKDLRKAKKAWRQSKVWRGKLTVLDNELDA
jgi:hypothetical protein